MGPFEALTLPDGDVLISDLEKNEFFKLSDSAEAYNFMREYVEDMKLKYPYHIKAIELKVKGETPSLYKQMQMNSLVYYTTVSSISLSCCFGLSDSIPDLDHEGNYNPEFVPCPCRKRCPFNGYNPRHADEQTVICNPVYFTGFTTREKELAALILGGETSTPRLAELQHVSIPAIDKMCTTLYKKAGVANRSEFILALKGKRI